MTIRNTDRLQESQNYRINFGVPILKTKIFVKYDHPVKYKELIFKVTVLDAQGDTIDPSEVSWSYSKSARSNYVYSPEGDENSISVISDLKSNSPFTQVILTPVRWNSSGTSPDILISDLWAVRQHPQERDGNSCTLGQILTVSSKEPK